MISNSMQTSFAAGELSPDIAGRVDLTKYQVGAYVMRNMFVGFQGGAVSRPGTEHVGVCALTNTDKPPRLIPFVFNSEQSYALEFFGGKMRVVSQGAYLFEPSRAVSGVSLGPTTTLTVIAHGWSAGQWVRVRNVNGAARPNGISGLNGRTLRIGSATTDTITLQTYALAGSLSAYEDIDSSAWSAWTTGGVVERLYEIDTPYAGADLYQINYAQSADVLTLVHPDYPAYDLRRLGQTNWQIVQRTYGASVAAPTGAAATAVNNDAARPQLFYAYCITTVDAAGRESVPTPAVTVLNRALNQSSEPQVVNTITWTPQPGAYKYRIYKATPVPNGQQTGGPYFFGLLGDAFDARFVDVNFAVEFDQGPPQGRNPFLNRGIAAAVIVDGGEGYLAPVVTVVDSTGVGASVAATSDTSLTAAPYGELSSVSVVSQGTEYTAPTAVVTDAAPLGSGLVLAFNGSWVPNPLGTHFVPAPGSITIANPGANYHRNNYSNFVRAVAGNQSGSNVLLIDITSVENGQVRAISWTNSDITPSASTGLSTTGGSDTLTFTIIGTDTAGSGASVVLTLGGTTNPSVVAYLQQRILFAGSRDQPATFWLSKPGQFTNFDVSDPVQDDDAITASLFSQEVNRIHSVVPTTSGAVALTSGGAFLITAGGQGGAVTPSTIQAPPQAFSGAQELAPLRIGDRVLYAQARGSAVRDIAFDFYTNAFTGSDVSVLSSHLLEGRKIVQWAYAEEPYKLAWCVRDDGVLLSLTYLREQEVFGWARHDTQGEFVSVCVVPEGRRDVPYFIVRRYVPDFGYRYHVERMADRTFGANPAAGVPAKAEDAWCVDGGAELPLRRPATPILFGESQSIGGLYEVTIVNGGSGYTGSVSVEVFDVSGVGGTVSVSVTGGVITAASVTAAGTGYVAPRVVVRGNGNGNGAVLAVRCATIVRLRTEGAAFSPADVNSVLRVRGGSGRIVQVPSGNEADVDFFNDLPSSAPNLPAITLPPVPAGQWSIASPVSVIGGLDHLNGSTVQVLADGSVQQPKTVVDGCITLDQPATRVIVGQGFTCQLQTMRIGAPEVQGARSALISMHIRVKDARGLVAGPTWDQLSEIKERDNTPAGSPIPLQIGGGLPLDPLYPGAPTAPAPLWYEDRYVIADGPWTSDGVVCIQQSYPLPATVLAVMPSHLFGDTAK